MPDQNLTCPKCAASREDLRLVYLIEASHGIEAESPGEVTVNTGHNNQAPGGSSPGLACGKCGTRWPLRLGISVVVRKDDGSKTRIFGPDGKAR